MSSMLVVGLIVVLFVGVAYAATRWQCSECGKTIGMSSRPSDKSGGKCPSTATGNHIWTQIS